ncbi:unnamed protein product [Bacillus phage SPP1]|uniref:Head completion protein gp16 n=1 Tax=Bacillus phage SPP1 TaxID=10724 RepID=HCP16_BPSPP|nr:head closure Hc1 [Bacillus phage SPP1]O48446.1 RecName: Full=Head completion protein gp16; AltName: Full=Connector protein gp16; AltName: Full=Gene product 16; Short=Gp16; AltName: Full=Stopper protein gp16 [Bacillus phage SPP1]7Z4W_1 Chain 1, Head completion protein gp16 [Bacillus subtilis]7Z4W_2 Chain 2, Head completion protein gp16 [Bacillus subtilis]7Z4W_3 Chain 3, Head completion protein gp16 [Bacillus subtilis]7Z4W_4 Chain 4, Head completion protein gp16 [Bacillus subtilis]7Z4W_5 Cha
MYEEFPDVITFQSYVEQSNGEGGKTYKWVDEFTAAAHVQPISQEEYYKAQQLQTPIGYNIYTPYDDRIDKKMRVIYRGKIVTFIGDPVDLSGLQEITRIKGKEDGAYVG